MSGGVRRFRIAKVDIDRHRLTAFTGTMGATLNAVMDGTTGKPTTLTEVPEPEMREREPVESGFA